MSKLLLIDGHSIINRAFYGVPDLTNESGLHVNAVYGFLNIMFKFIDEENPDHIAVAFDMKAPTFRHETYDAYKGTRKPMPEELREQVPVVKEVLTAMGVAIFEQAGIEADDILGSFAKKAEAEGMEVSLISGDRDLLQIATDRIKICIPKTKGGKTETEYYYASDVLEKYQVPPSGIIELKALMGDTADNIPGVPKVGEKTATALLVQYGTVENVYAHLDEITKKGLHDTLEANEDKAKLSHFLATIKTDCELLNDWNDVAMGNLYTVDAYDYLRTLGLKSILKRFEGRMGEVPTETSKIELITVEEFTDFDKLFIDIKNVKDTSDSVSLADGKLSCRGILYFYYHVVDGELESVSLSFDGKDYVIPIQGFITEGYVTDSLSKIIEDEEFLAVTYDAKKAYRYINPDIWATPQDVRIISYLLNPIKERVQDTTPGVITHELAIFYSEGINRLATEGMYELYRDIEMPLTKVLYSMEKDGIRVDRDKLIAYGESLTDRINKLEQSIHEQAGVVFNINSPKQLGEILFEKLELQGGKKTKTGYSTAADVLEKLAVDNQIVADILEYRGLAKLKSTYAEGLLECIASDGRIHSNFNQTITATGRISSTEPNLQNIPIRTELGRQIRKCFVPKENCVFIDADYSQIELRLLAHMSEDEGLIEAYNSDADIHSITASKVFGIPFDEVTPEKRRDAKAVNFGLVYGISSFGLSQDLGISRKEAAAYIEEYFKTYPGVRKFLDDTVEKAKQDGYVTTLYGRRRPIPELKNSNFMMRQFGERVAMNSPLQGTAADIMKIAMIKVYEALKSQEYEARILVQVHDELLLEVEANAVDRAMKLLHDEMKNAVSLAVALEVDVHSGKDWYEAK